MKPIEEEKLTNLTEHFTIKEFTQSETARRLGIDNVPKPYQIDNMRTLCKQVLEPLRKEFGAIIITSGFRSAKLNKAVGGVMTSQHTKGEAADLRIDNEERGQEMFEWIKNNTVFDQLIMEHSRKTGASWLHVSSKYGKKNNRHQVMEL